MKILVIGESNKSSGGSYHQSLKTFNILSKIKDYQFYFLNTKSTFDEENHINYKISFFDKIFFLFYSSNFLKLILKKAKIKNNFEKFIKKNKFDLVLFLGCSRLSFFCDNINFLTYVYEFHHLKRPDLPEYRGWADFDFRENLLIQNCKKSIALIVDTKKKSNDLVKYYNCDENKISVIPLSPNISLADEPKILNKELISKNVLKKNEDFFFYPAQYWPHKNHYYILLAIQSLNKKYNIFTKFIFTGFKKNNFNFLKKKVNEFNIKEQIFFLEYLDDYEISYLYKRCKAIVMPTLVGYSSLPLYEAFYYKKPIFYTKDLLDKELQNFVNQIDIENPEDLADQIFNFEKNENALKQKIKSAKDYFNQNLVDNKIEYSYSKFFRKIEYLTNIYK